MWRELSGNLQHDPFTWLLLAAGAIILFWWIFERRRRKFLVKFAFSRGFRFERHADPANLRLNEPPFLWSRTASRMSFAVFSTEFHFVLFDQQAHRGPKRQNFVQTIAMFELKAGAQFRPSARLLLFFH
jgi:hypothetical protein